LRKNAKELANAWQAAKQGNAPTLSNPHKISPYPAQKEIAMPNELKGILGLAAFFGIPLGFIVFIFWSSSRRTKKALAEGKTPGIPKWQIASLVVIVLVGLAGNIIALANFFLIRRG
jgi:hypothetical protein